MQKTIYKVRLFYNGKYMKKSLKQKKFLYLVFMADLMGVFSIIFLFDDTGGCV